MVYLFHGKNSYISLRSAKSHIENLISQSPGLTLKSIDADSTDPNTILTDLYTTPMFVEKEIILLKRVMENRAKKAIIDTLIKMITEGGSDKTFVFWEGAKVPSNTIWFKAIKKHGNIQEAEVFNKNTFSRWAKEELIRHKIKIDHQALQKLISASNYDAERIVSTFEKFHLSDLEEIKSEHLSQFTTDTLEYEIWDLIDCINRRDRAGIADLLDRLLKQGVEPIFMLSMIVRNLRQVVLVKEMSDSGATDREIASTLKIPPFTIPKVRAEGNASDMAKLARLYEKLHNLDYEIKIGNIEPALGLTLLATIL